MVTIVMVMMIAIMVMNASIVVATWFCFSNLLTYHGNHCHGNDDSYYYNDYSILFCVFFCFVLFFVTQDCL